MNTLIVCSTTVHTNEDTLNRFTLTDATKMTPVPAEMNLNLEFLQETSITG